MARKLSFEDAEKVRDSIMRSQQKEIAALYSQWAKDVAKMAEEYSRKGTASAPLQERQLKELQAMLEKASKKVTNEVYTGIKSGILRVAQSVVIVNNEWLESLGFSKQGVEAAFSYVPDFVVKSLITGQVYKSGWSLSKALWGDNETTLKDIYTIVAKGRAENLPIYDIAKELERYVNPSKRLAWNYVRADGTRIYKKKVDYVAQRLARTLSQHAYQQAFKASTESNPLITGYRWHAMHDTRTCEICKKRNGKVFAKDKLPLDHPNGFCIMEAVQNPNTNDILADWVRSPEGKYPKIDKFAKMFDSKQ